MHYTTWAWHVVAIEKKYSTISLGKVKTKGHKKLAKMQM